jgi:flagellar protein FlbT
MSGLILKLAPNERFIINGAVVENGDRPGVIRIRDRQTRILRCRDALLPDDANTPVRRVYYAVQLIVTGDLPSSSAREPAMQAACTALGDAFGAAFGGRAEHIGAMIARGEYHSVLCLLRQMMLVESALLARDDAACTRTKAA